MPIKFRNIGCIRTIMMGVVLIYSSIIIIKSFYPKSANQVDKNEMIDTTYNGDKEIKQLCDSLHIDYNTKIGRAHV